MPRNAQPRGSRHMPQGAGPVAEEVLELLDGLASGTALACASGATQNAAAASVRSHTPWWTYCRVKSR